MNGECKCVEDDSAVRLLTVEGGRVRCSPSLTTANMLPLRPQACSTSCPTCTKPACFEGGCSCLPDDTKVGGREGGRGVASLLSHTLLPWLRTTDLHDLLWPLPGLCLPIWRLHVRAGRQQGRWVIRRPTL